MLRRPRREPAGNRDVGDLEAERLRVDLGALADLVDGLEADAEEADLALLLGGLADGEDADDVAGVEGRPVVPDGDGALAHLDAPARCPRVLGVLQQLDEEVPGIGVDAPGEQLLGVRLRDGLGGSFEDGEDARGEVFEPAAPPRQVAGGFCEALELGQPRAAQPEQERIGEARDVPGGHGLGAGALGLLRERALGFGRGVLEPAVHQADGSEPLEGQRAHRAGDGLDDRAERFGRDRGAIEAPQDAMHAGVGQRLEERAQRLGDAAVGGGARSGQAPDQVGERLVIAQGAEPGEQLRELRARLERLVDGEELVGEGQRGEGGLHGSVGADGRWALGSNARRLAATASRSSPWRERQCERGDSQRARAALEEPRERARTTRRPPRPLLSPPFRQPSAPRGNSRRSRGAAARARPSLRESG